MTGHDHYSGGGEKTVAKQVILERYIKAYLNIIPNFYDQYWYVDTHSGTGYSEEFDTPIAGSTLRALRYDFQRYYFYEKKYDHWETLCATIEDEIEGDLYRGELDDGSPVATAKQPYIQIINKDCNDGVTWLVTNSSWNPHWFTFVDPEKFSVTLELMETLRNRGNMDILLNFQTEGFYRNTSENADHSHETVTESLGEGWPTNGTPDEYVEYYKKTVFTANGWNARSRKMVSEGSNGWRYDLIFASENDTADKIMGDIFGSSSIKDEISAGIRQHRDEEAGGQQSLGSVRVDNHGEDDDGQANLFDF